MTLATHGAVGAAVAALFPNHPVEAFVAGFLSHFVLDSIPHWDYKILSSYANPDNAKQDGVKPDSAFVKDLVRVSLDMLIGVSVVICFYGFIGGDWEIYLLGIIGGVLPDFLQFVYARFTYQPMVAIQKIHEYIHTDLRLKKMPVIGIITQAIIVVFFVALVRYLNFF